MKITFLALVLGLFQTNAYAQSTALLKGFTQDAVDQKLSNVELGDKYFCTSVLHRTDEYGEKARKGLNWILTTQRPQLREQRINLAELTFTPYDSLSTSELPPKPFHMLGETKQVYVAQYHGKIILYFLLQDDKIASTLLIGQGIEHYFLNFCK